MGPDCPLEHHPESGVRVGGQRGQHAGCPVGETMGLRVTRAKEEP